MDEDSRGRHTPWRIVQSGTEKHWTLELLMRLSPLLVRPSASLDLFCTGHQLEVLRSLQCLSSRSLSTCHSKLLQLLPPATALWLIVRPPRTGPACKREGTDYGQA